LELRPEIETVEVLQTVLFDLAHPAVVAGFTASAAVDVRFVTVLQTVGAVTATTSSIRAEEAARTL
jgi:hypothetical protein